MVKQMSLILVLIIITVSWAVPAEAINLGRRGIELEFDHQMMDDGFGNIRSISIDGAIANTSDQDASRISVVFILYWESRKPIEKKLKFKNLKSGKSQEFQFEIELGTNPDTLVRIEPKLARIKFSKTRHASTKSKKDISNTLEYNLSRLNEEGNSFRKVLDRLKSKNSFKERTKDEFETTDEYETSINFDENVHFGKLMDVLEKSYGEIIGGRGAVIRFLPRTVKDNLIYVSENSAVFQIPIRFGRFNADLDRFEDVNLIPRTFPFPPITIVPDSAIGLIHKGGIFFLRKSFFDIHREEARILRNTEQHIILEITFRTGIIQDGPYPEDFCIVEKILLKNKETGKIHRKWTLLSD